MTSPLGRAWRPVRTVWRRLTSMRTALILLFLLAVAAVPGSLLPQRPLNPSATSTYIANHGGWGRFLDSIGMFDVFGSIWFAAIYLLLFISLVGCLIPRIRVHARAMVRKPLPAPHTLSRLPESGRFETDASVADYTRDARAVLGRRWRIVQREEAGGTLTLSAEKGYSRETANLIFHLALLAALLLIAIGRLYAYQGTRIVVQGDGFCNVVYQYDEWKPGRFAAEGKVTPAPFCINDMSKFTATYTADGEPKEFRADVTYRRNVDAAPQKTSITVNHPLRLEGDRVYLIGHGFAPRVTVRMPDGTTRTSTSVFVPTVAATLQSEGVFKFQGKDGAKQDIGLRGFFAPSPVQNLAGVVSSVSPAVRNPVLGLFIYEGDLTGKGTAQTVYTIDTTKMTRIGAVNLHEGDRVTLKNGVQVTFDGWVPWASLQVSHDPAQGYLLIAAVAMVVGLIGSLGVRRRRLWLRVSTGTGVLGTAGTDVVGAPGADGADRSPTVVSVGGLARSDSGNFSTEFSALLERLQDAGTPVWTRGEQDARDVDRGDPIGAGKD